MRLCSLATVVLLGPAVAALMLSCSGPPKGELERKVTSRASISSFRVAGVTTVFERRCGTLDCHGSTARNMRIYSARGLRLPNEAGTGPGAGQTTLDEITASYQSILTLEPEITNAVLDGEDPYQLLVMKKPLEIEKHKGGPAIRKGDDAERCILTWLKEDRENPVDVGACSRAATFPKL